jgi:hypothetical protein
MGLGESVGDGGPSANLGVAVVVAEDVEDSAAEGVVDLAAVGETGVGGGGDVDALAVLDEELLEATGGEGCDDAIRCC